MYKRILVATDGSTLSKKAVASAVQLASLTGAELTAVRVIPRYPQSYFEGSLPLSMLEIGKIEPSDLVLVLGASGGVGIACVQIAKMLGARVIAAAGSEDKCKKLSEIGADYTIDYSKQDFSREAWTLSGKTGVDVIVNYTGGDTWIPSLRSLKRRGKLLTCGATAGSAGPFTATITTSTGPMRAGSDSAAAWALCT